MTRADYEYGRRLILARLQNAQRLRREALLTQVNFRARLAARIEKERAELAKWDERYQAEQRAANLIDPQHYEEPSRQMCGVV